MEHLGLVVFRNTFSYYSVSLSVTNHARSITLSFFDGFLNYFAEILTTMTLYYHLQSGPYLQGQGHTYRSNDKNGIFHVSSVTLSFVDGF